MSKHGKKYVEASKLVEKKLYGTEEAIALLKKVSTTKFDSTAEVHFSLDADPRQADQNIRGTVSLPHGTGKEVRVIAFVDEGKMKEAKAAGAIEAGMGELIEKIEKGWLDFDVAVADPMQMKGLGKIAKILGTKGLMPNPKAGTVSTDIGGTIALIKKGRVEFRIDKLSNVHTIFGKVSFDEGKLRENLLAITKSILDAKPASIKGTYVKSVTIAATMSPGIKLDVNATVAEANK